ncbi:hypothetical protein ABEF95_004431 [Exophiala dermatitidis]|uniref:F-box domain-containing protein n=1 Tax=Exophiala dermatitidis (strain ATCC 34100 / CBS 525.76 / NIH/UT8656) TaxID=858893 RepID=H6BL85_EXODN|nr:uncharacterized protein HMPREF1120_00057 [Exophiala dermatitidis NIH/UT8656]EHY51832.1 hypothetical protein HMPREF1120_00057 [Exophiala dermatitidis NIH/UT8656]
MGLFGRRVANSPPQTSAASSTPPTDSVVQNTPLLQLPPEIIHQILCYLHCQSLVSLARTCRQLRELTQEDLLWANLLRATVPPADFPSDPYPSSSYRDLYISHHPYWFLPRYKIWISDESYIGRAMICRFDPRRGCIEGYRMLAERQPSMGIFWPYKPNVVIHSFEPRVHLYLDDPILKLPHDVVPFTTRQGWWEAEIKMSVGRPGHNTSASFSLARNIPEHLLDKSMVVWPPWTIPGMPRVRAASVDNFRGSGHKPQKHDEISQTAFRLRQWSQFSTGMAHFGIRVGEEVSTWSTIDPSLYTPTPEKPYQGIFVGDYAGHGCEFLLVMQTDKAPPVPTRPSSRYYRTMVGLEDDDDSSEEEFEEESSDEEREPPPPPARPNNSPSAAQDDDGVHRGAIEAVKLTGDPNIPRGEHTFIADDIGPNGLIRIAQEHPFKGARVVRSRGHVAARGFQDDKFIPSQLIMISHDKLAQYWLPYGHVSFYERVDIDKLMDETLRQPNSGG